RMQQGFLSCSTGCGQGVASRSLAGPRPGFTATRRLQATHVGRLAVDARADARPATIRLGVAGTGCIVHAAQPRPLGWRSKLRHSEREQPMPATRDDLFSLLTNLGIESTTHEHEAVFTVAESSDLHERIPGGHSKNLFLKDKKGKLFLVVAL